MPFNLKRLKRRLDKDRSGNKYLTDKELKLRRKQRRKTISKMAKKLRKGVNPIPKNDPILEDVNPNPYNVERTNCGSFKEESVLGVTCFLNLIFVLLLTIAVSVLSISETNFEYLKELSNEDNLPLL